MFPGIFFFALIHLKEIQNFLSGKRNYRLSNCEAQFANKQFGSVGERKFDSVIRLKLLINKPITIQLL
jgi:hypothetical protein